jgi:hypothetical protein
MKTIISMLMILSFSSAFGQPVSMFDLMNMGYRESGIKFTEAEAFEQSVVVVRGYIDSVTEGRVANYTDALLNVPDYTALFKVEVSEVLKGNVDGKYVYFERVRGGVPAEFYEAVKYEGEVILYLKEINWFNPATTIVTDSDKGLMKEVNHLYQLFSDEFFFAQNLDPTAVRKTLPSIPVPEDAPRDTEGRLLRDPVRE